MYSCPECEQLINQASEVCPYCGADQKALADTELLLAGKTPKPTRTNYKRVAASLRHPPRDPLGHRLVRRPLEIIRLENRSRSPRPRIPGRHPTSHQHLSTKRRQRPALPGNSRRHRPQSRPIRATSPLHPAIHSRQTRPHRPHHRLHPNSPRRKFRLPQLLHRRIRHRPRHHRRPRPQQCKTLRSIRSPERCSTQRKER